MSTTTTPKRPVGRSGWNASLAEKLEIIDFYGRHKAKGMGYGLTARHFAQKWGYQNGLNAAAVRWCWMKREKIMKQVAGSNQAELEIKRELDEEDIFEVPKEEVEMAGSRLSEEGSSPENTKKARKYSPEQKADFIRLYDEHREGMTMSEITRLFESRWALSPIHRRVVSRWLANRESLLQIPRDQIHHHHHHEMPSHHHHHHSPSSPSPQHHHHRHNQPSSYGIGFVYDFETNEIMYL